MYSTKKFEIIRHMTVKGVYTESLLFAHENEADIMNKLNELEVYAIREQLVVLNNNTHQWDYAWRCLRQINDVRVWD